MWALTGHSIMLATSAEKDIFWLTTIHRLKMKILWLLIFYFHTQLEVTYGSVPDIQCTVEIWWDNYSGIHASENWQLKNSNWINITDCFPLVIANISYFMEKNNFHHPAHNIYTILNCIAPLVEILSELITNPNARELLSSVCMHQHWDNKMQYSTLS